MTTPVEQVQALLTVDGLRQWLESKPPESEAGYCQNAAKCVVQQYLDEQGFTTRVGGRAIDLFPSDLDLRGDWKIIDLPEDVKRFVRAVDQTAPFDWPITAAEALHALRQVTQEVGAVA